MLRSNLIDVAAAVVVVVAAVGVSKTALSLPWSSKLLSREL